MHKKPISYTFVVLEIIAKFINRAKTEMSDSGFGKRTRNTGVVVITYKQFFSFLD